MSIAEHKVMGGILTELAKVKQYTQHLETEFNEIKNEMFERMGIDQTKIGKEIENPELDIDKKTVTVKPKVKPENETVKPEQDKVAKKAKK